MAARAVLSSFLFAQALAYPQSSGLLSGLLPSLGTSLGQTLNQTTGALVQTVGCLLTNGPLSRNCWTQGTSILTDFDQLNPLTGHTVTYNWEITNTTCNPDGHGAIQCLLVNNQYPGPVLRANWGDVIVVNVKNSMQDNGTTIHWHGVRQFHSPGADGVPGLTECPLAPGQSRQYKFTATQHGSSWYHSHYSSQYGSGVVGPIVFDGPATANYDVDLGPYTQNEWYYHTAWQQNAIAQEALQNFGAPPNPDNLLINGTNKNAQGGGQYNQVTITKGKKYRLRLTSIALDNYIRVSLDNHPFQIIAADFVPIKPIPANWILLGAGQRYDVIITANQTAGSYWFRSEVATECLSGNNFYGRAIWTYSGQTAKTPTTTAFPEPNDCLEPGPLTPEWYQPVPQSTFQQQLGVMDVDLTKAVVTPGGDVMVVWALNKSIDIDWTMPTMNYLFNQSVNDANLDTYKFPDAYNVVPATKEGTWNYWLIQQADNAAIGQPAGLEAIVHPIHLHGHDFYVLGQGSGAYSSSAKLNFNTPTRRDTASLYGGGWLAIAFESNNPGPWLMHCHIAWHISEGLGMQFLEAPSETTLPDKGAYDSECSSWASYYAHAAYKKEDSGL